MTLPADRGPSLASLAPRPRRRAIPAPAIAIGCVAAVAAGVQAASDMPSAAERPGVRLDDAPVAFRLDLADAPVLLGALGRGQDGGEPADPPAAADASASVASWSTEAGAEGDPLVIAREQQPKYGKAGSTRLDFRFGYGTDVKDGDQWIAQGGIGITGFIEDGLALRAELNGAQISQVEGSEQGLNFALLFEWHFHQAERWSLFLDGGAGVLFTTDDVPAIGSSFNFTPQAGIGWTGELADDFRLILGVRWHHISNANTFDENPGRDHIMVYTGFSLPF